MTAVVILAAWRLLRLTGEVRAIGGSHPAHDPDRSL
jgi:hypothetical protein